MSLVTNTQLRQHTSRKLLLTRGNILEIAESKCCQTYVSLCACVCVYLVYLFKCFFFFLSYRKQTIDVKHINQAYSSQDRKISFQPVDMEQIWHSLSQMLLLLSQPRSYLLSLYDLGYLRR